MITVIVLVVLAAVPVGSLAATKGAVVVPRLRNDRLAVIVNFSSLSNIESISYCLTYTSNGRRQGACGTALPYGQPTITRELLLGTCSKKICTYFSNVKNLSLAVRSKLKTDHPKYVTRSFRFRI